jgi:hypothetical protein
MSYKSLNFRDHNATQAPVPETLLGQDKKRRIPRGGENALTQCYAQILAVEECDQPAAEE